MKRIYSALIMAPLFLSTLHINGAAYAQSTRQQIQTLYVELQTAVCANDWDRALNAINPMIDSSHLSPSYRRELVQFRQRIYGWRSSNAMFLNAPHCQRSSTPSRPSASEPLAHHSATESQADGLGNQDETSSRPTLYSAFQSESQSESPSTLQSGNLHAQCVALETIVQRADSQSLTMSQQTDVSNLSALLQMLSDLANLSDQTVANLESIPLSDGQLRTYQQHLISIYTGFGQATRGFVRAANAGQHQTMETSNAQIQSIATQESALISQINTYCGRRTFRS